MKKVITKHGGCQTSIAILAERKTYTPPVIIEQFTQDDGEVAYILESGNTQLKNSYDDMWRQSKGKILPKSTKGKSLDPRSNYY